MTHRGPFQPLLFCDSVISNSVESLLRTGIKDKLDLLPSDLITAQERWKGRLNPHPPQDTGKPVPAADGQGQLLRLLFKPEQITAVLTYYACKSLHYLPLPFHGS